MNLRKIIKNTKKSIKNINIFILLTLLLLLFSVLYFLYRRQRTRESIYALVTPIQTEKTNLTASFNWVPYWIADSVNKEDKEISPLGGINTVVVEKEEYDAWSNGKFVFLTLKINVIKDRSGTYLYKNKPLLVGNTIELKLPKVQTNAAVLYVGNSLPEKSEEKLIVKLEEKQVEKWTVDALNSGDTVINNKGKEIVKIIDKKVFNATPIGMTYESQSGRFLYNNDIERKNIELIIEITAEKINDDYFFMKTKKIKVGESLFLSFPNVNIDFPITSVMK